MKKLIALVLVVSCVGCRTISSEAAHQITVEAAAHLADLREWDAMSPEERKQAYIKSTRAFVVLDFSVNDVPIPEGAPK